MRKKVTKEFVSVPDKKVEKETENKKEVIQKKDVLKQMKKEAPVDTKIKTGLPTVAAVLKAIDRYNKILADTRQKINKGVDTIPEKENQFKDESWKENLFD